MTRWGILGDGAIGGLFAARLALAGYSVQLVMSKAFHQGETKRSLHYQDDQQQVDLELTICDHTEQCDMLLICTKGYQVVDALTSIRLSKHTQLITLHNGMGPQQQLVHRYPEHLIWAGTTTHGAERHQNIIRHQGTGITTVGRYPSGQSEQLPPLWIMELNAALADVVYHPHIEQALWQKLAINAIINPITAIAQCLNGELLTPSYQPLIRELANEIHQVAKACQIILSDSDIIQSVRQVCQHTANNHSSMAEDIRCQRQTEIGLINGYIIRKAQEHQIEVPLNQQVVEKILKGDCANG
ncbi:ketopantoate reductase family protein [Celerinatantimonas yamalensis]|uniref:2-dehydropantoate 2-reductase n=1 Tax=Celerinatantimonas yamalensis TaxID=559956 RepID=A0ABW9G9J7_9GAMM